MKKVSNAYKQDILKNGRMIDAIVIYENLEIDSSNINQMTPTFKGDLLKSTMLGIEIDCNIQIPKDSKINAKFGVLVNNEFEYIDYGIYNVKSCDYNADTLSYKIIGYDNLIKFMVDVDDDFIQNITYPISVGNYLEAICNKVGIKLKSKNFINANTFIRQDVHSGLGYKYRDILDEIAQVTGGTICMYDEENLEVRYPNETGEIIDEHWLKDRNITIGEKYGPVNALVFGRVNDSDTINKRNETSILNNGLCEIKISNNQILSTNDRDEFIQELFDYLNGLEFFLCDYETFGITYLELCDKYSILLNGTSYPTIMLNNETSIGQGLGDKIYVEKPKSSISDYKTSSATDKMINQTYLLVDKQNQQIQSVVSQTEGQNQKISELTQSVNEIKSQISEVADITISADGFGSVSLVNINESEPIYIRIYPTNNQDITYIYPRDNLYPSDNLFSKGRTLRFESVDYRVDYELPNDLLYYDENNYDEFILDYDAQTCEVNKKVAYNADGTKYILASPQTIRYEYPSIAIQKGNYTVTMVDYEDAFLFVRMMVQNIYTDQFATKMEMSSAITQSAESIKSEVSATYTTKNQVNSSINQMANSITSEVSETYATKNELKTAQSEIKQTTDSITQSVNSKIEGVNGEIDEINGSLELKVNTKDLISEINASANVINLQSNRFIVNSNNLKITQNGSLTCSNANITGGSLNVASSYSTPKIQTSGTGQAGFTNTLRVYPDGIRIFDSSNEELGQFAVGYKLSNGIKTPILGLSLGTTSSVDSTSIKPDNISVTGTRGNGTFINSGSVETPVLYQTSLVEMKKNIEKQIEGLSLINNADIYNYNLKHEEDKQKKHIGVVIGEGYNTPNEILSADNKLVDLYSMIAVSWRAIQELNDKVKYLEEKLKESDSNGKDRV